MKAFLIQTPVRCKATGTGSTRLQQAQYVNVEEEAVMLTPGSGLFPTQCIVLLLTKNTKNIYIVLQLNTMRNPKNEHPNRHNFDHFSIFVLLLKTLLFTLCCLVRFLNTVYQNIQYLSNISFSVKMSRCPKGESRRYKSASLYTALNRKKWKWR